MPQYRSDSSTDAASQVGAAPSLLREPAVDVEASGLSDRGLQRPANEDHFLISRVDRSWRVLQTNVPGDAFPPLVTDSITAQIVADGMGGRAGGAVASRTAIAAFVDIVQRTPNLILRVDKHTSEDVLHRMAQRFEQVKAALEDVVRRDPTLSGMGTTMTLACNFGANLLVAHVGDSRAYLYRQGQLARLTRDQTMGQFLRETGVLSDEQLAKHPMRHVLTSVLGTQGSPIDVELRFVRLEDADRILLCSDGLTEMVSDAEIADVLGAAPSAADACRRLIDLANERGGRDNVTVVVSRYRLSNRQA